ncbi:transketolase [Geminicoccus roseus]|uniref:transketolase n=1 Tax=Geminicoccus roseus TaxID=404900 RepID=UPI000422763C|nr:transketolase [Geminicoccus roseus]
MNNVSTHDLANAVRFLAVDAVEKANSGHPGMPMGMAEVATVLFTRHLKFDAGDPKWADRDRFVLSAGHGSMLLYALLYLTGVEGVDIEDLRNFRQFGARTAGHPEYGHAPGIETTTGPLGQGFANAVGMAIAEAHLAARFGKDLVDHHTYVIAGDGCLMEGISHEAGALAGHLKLNKLIVLWDDNGISIDGKVSMASSEDVPARFAAYGWATDHVDGHDPEAVDAAIARAKTNGQPTLIACRTVIGKGAPTKAGGHGVHGSPLGKDETAATRLALNWAHEAFELPEAILNGWREVGRRGARLHADWQERLHGSPERQVFETAMAAKPSEAAKLAMQAYKAKLVQDKPSWATRKSSEEALKVLTAEVPELIGGSADLTGSNNTKTPSTVSITPDDLSGRYLHYGVREHGMMAAMNGIALHGGLIPYGGTFLVFTDYCRASIRLAALMGIRSILVGTHDSIGLGEDGPTHQPVEHLAALRAIPNLLVMRPADAVETAECWEAAVETVNQPTVLALSRQNLPAVRTTDSAENLSAKGAYVLAEADGARAVTILATGSEVHIALDARQQLQAAGIPAAVVSMPSWELFARQKAAYRGLVLGTAPRVAIEAASPFGWTRFVDSEDDVIGMKGFGASGPAPTLYKEFGITAEAVVALVRKKLAA